MDLIVNDVYFWGVFTMLLGPKEARPPVLTIGVLPLIVSSADVGPFSGPDVEPRRSVSRPAGPDHFIETPVRWLE